MELMQPVVHLCQSVFIRGSTAVSRMNSPIPSGTLLAFDFGTKRIGSLSRLLLGQGLAGSKPVDRDPGRRHRRPQSLGRRSRRLGLWFITNVPAEADLGETVSLYRRGMENLRGTFSSLISPYEAHDTEARIAALTSAGVPADVAEDIGVLPLMAAAPEVALLAHNQSLNLDLVAGAYFAMGAEVGLDRLRGLAQRITGGEHWDHLAIRRISDDLFAGQRALTAAALAMLPPEKAKGARAEGVEAVKLWAASKADALVRARSFLAALERTGELSVAKLTLANSQIHELAGR